MSEEDTRTGGQKTASRSYGAGQDIRYRVTQGGARRGMSGALCSETNFHVKLASKLRTALHMKATTAQPRCGWGVGGHWERHGGGEWLGTEAGISRSSFTPQIFKEHLLCAECREHND